MDNPNYRFNSRPCWKGGPTRHELMVNIDGDWWAIHKDTPPLEDANEVEKSLWTVACARIRQGPTGTLKEKF